MSEEFDNAYDDNTESEATETPTFDQVLNAAITARLLEVHTSMPAKIVKVRSNSIVDIQPLLQRKYTDGKLVNMPIIQNVPISHPRGKDYWIKLPIKVDDVGTALFSERSLDTWIVKGGFVDPNDPRTHDLSDAMFIPGLYPTTDIVPGAADDLIVHNGKAEMKIQKPGTFIFKNAQNEMMDLLDQTLIQLKLIATTLGQDTTNTIFGPTKLNSFQTYVNSAAAIDTIKTKFETLKGS